MSNATEETVYEFLRGQYPGLSKKSFAKALTLYPLLDYDGSLGTQGEQMYGEARYICPAVLAGEYGRKVYQYRCVCSLPG